MKKNKLLLFLTLLSLTLTVGCYQGDDTGDDEEEEPISSDTSLDNSSSEDLNIFYEDIDRGIYNEKMPSKEGLSEEELKDFSLLLEALGKIEKNYTKETQVFFNKEAVNRVNIIYDTEFVQNVKTLYSTNCVYMYDNSGKVNEGYVTKGADNNTYKVSLEGETVEERLVSKVKQENLELVSEDKNVDDYLFTINDINQEYIDKYGPCTIKYTSTYSVKYEGWTRIGEKTFKCDREEVIVNFLNYLVPGFTNEGTYMTFRYVTVELDVDEETPIRLRLYCSPTQIGKLIDAHCVETVEDVRLIESGMTYDEWKEYKKQLASQVTPTNEEVSENVLSETTSSSEEILGSENDELGSSSSEDSSLEEDEGLVETGPSAWYLLFAEGVIKDVNNTSIVALENYVAG